MKQKRFGGNGGRLSLEETPEDIIIDNTEPINPEKYVIDFNDDENDDSIVLEERNVAREINGTLSGIARDIEVRLFIVYHLAEFCEPEDISKEVAKHLRANIPAKDIVFIKDKLENGKKLQGQQWGVLIRKYRHQRNKFLTELKNIPIANRKVRLQELQKLFTSISKNKATTEQAPIMDSRTGKQKVNNKGDLVFRTVTQKSKKDVSTATAILKQAAQEVGDWTEKAEKDTDTSWAELMKALQSQTGQPVVPETEDLEENEAQSTE